MNDRFERAVNWTVDLVLDALGVVLAAWFLMFATAALGHPVSYGRCVYAFLLLFGVVELGVIRHRLHEEQRTERKARKAARS